MSKGSRAALLCAATAAAAVTLGSPARAADVVRLDATSLPDGPLSTWTNTGTAGGTFNSSGAGTPTVTNVGGVNAVQFNNVEGSTQAAEFYISSFSSPVTGGASRTLEVWAFNPVVGSEETLIQNGGQRGGGSDGRNNSFNYGNHNAWGAHGAWAEGDLGWDGTPASGAGTGDTAPAAGQWHQLVYTYTAAAGGAPGHHRVYADGQLENSENITLDTTAGVLRIAAQAEGTGHLLGLNGAIARVRVADASTSAAEVVNRFNTQAATFNHVARTAATSPMPVNRYEFSTDASDSVGNADGQVLSRGAPPVAAQFSGGRLNLGNSGTDNQNGNYVELPDNVLSALSGAATIEFWGTWGGGNQWQRSFDLGGNHNDGGPTPAEYVFVTPRSGAGGPEGDSTLLEIKDEVGGSFAGIRRADSGETPVGQEVQYVAVFDPATNQARLYIDGTLANTAALDGLTLAGLGNDNNWLGRSKFIGDAFLSGSINEFRIYDAALSDAQVLGNFLAGPDNLNVVPEPTALGLLGLAGGLILRRRRRRAAN